MSNILAFVSIKGGVGKTTLALETASSLANHYNKSVLLVDANFSAPNIGLYLDLTHDLTLHDALSGTMLHNTIYEAHGIDVIPASMYYHDPVDPWKLSKLLEKYKTRYDYIIIDSSPNYEELRPVVAAANKIFLVTSADDVTLSTTLKAARVAREQETPIEGIIVNKVRSPKHEFDVSQIERISEIPVLAKIKEDKKMAASIFEKTPITVLNPSNKVSKEISNFASAICGYTESQSWIQAITQKKFVKKEKVNRNILRDRFYE